MKIRIIGKDWTRKLVRPVLGDDSGGCDFDKCLIQQSTDECEQQRRDTLAHEIFHAISDSLGLKVKESETMALGCVWVQVLRENPELVEYLLKEDE